MAERYTRVFLREGQMYCPGAPVIIQARALLKDNQTGNTIAQLKFHNVSEKRIKALKVSLAAYDISNTEVDGVNDFQYLDLNVNSGCVFGSKNAIVMPVPATRSFDVASMVVVFADGSVWESTGGFTVLPVAKSLTVALDGAELVKQYQLATNASAAYVPAENQDLWQCACGTWNRGTQCSHCRILKSKAFSALDTALLTEQMNNRLAKEQEQREAEAAQQKKNKKRLTIFAIIALVVAILLVAGITIYNKITELTIEKMLALYTKEDVVALLAKQGKDANGVAYDVSFNGDKYSLVFEYSDTTINNWSMQYRYPGIAKLSEFDTKYYEITDKDKATAKAVVSELEESFKEKYGEPQVRKTIENVTTYTWIVNDRMIEVEDYTSNRELSRTKAVSICVNCDHQSFCMHTDTKEEHLDASCVDNGYNRTTCTICGYVDETEIKALGHSGTTEITQAATCTEPGIQVVTCSVCANRTEESVPALGHDHKKVETKAAGCVTEGTYTHTCSRCSDAYTTSIPALGHNYSSATCTEASICSRCGSQGTAALGHTTSTGVCSRCNYNLTAPLYFSGKASYTEIHYPITLPYGTYKITIATKGNGFFDTTYANIDYTESRAVSGSGKAGIVWVSCNGNETKTETFTSGIENGYLNLDIWGDVEYEVSIVPVN